MTHELCIENASVFRGNELVKTNIIIDEGRIVSVSSSFQNSERKIDASGKIIIPGLIDPHVHVGEPGNFPGYANEDFGSASRAAAAGGVTTIFEMPQAIPPTTTVETFKNRSSIAANKAIVDYAFIAGAGSGNIPEISKLADAGVIAFKTFLVTEEDYPEINDLCAIDNYGLFKTLGEVAKTGLPHIFHAEDNDLMHGLMAELQSQGRNDIHAFSDSRPVFQETMGVIRAIHLAKWTASKIVIAHVSSAEVLETIRDAKKKGIRVFAEGRPDYFIFTQSDLAKAGPYLKITPPVREKGDVEAMWNALDEGLIDFIGSDHAPATREGKEMGRNDIWTASSGIPILELSLPLLLNEATKRGFPISTLCAAMTRGPAKAFDIYPRKGSLEPGSDADLVIINPKLRKKVSVDNMQTKGKGSASFLEGIELQGWPTCTIAGGEIIMQDGLVQKVDRKPNLITPNSSSRHK